MVFCGRNKMGLSFGLQRHPRHLRLSFRQVGRLRRLPSTQSLVRNCEGDSRETALSKGKHKALE